MIINKNSKINKVTTDVKINRNLIERVVQYKYLSCVINENLTFQGHFKFVQIEIAQKNNGLNRIFKKI